MMTLLLSAVLLSLDSLVVSLALSPLIQSSAQRWRWAALFGLCDGGAVMIGFAFGGVGGSETFAHRTVPLIALCCGIYCMLAAHWNKFRADPRLALALPVLMSFDNLAYGVGIDPTAGNVTGRAAVLGLASFSLALLGLLAGGVIRFPNLRAREWTAGLGMVAACLVLFFW